MQTNLSQELGELELRWGELATLVGVVRGKYAEEESAEYKALCRSITVLTCSHLEGSLKAVSRAVVRDINDFSRFADAPASLRRKYIERVLLQSGGAAVNQNLVNNLDGALVATDIEMNEQALFAKNGNPKPELVEGYYKLFKGDKADIFSLLGSSRLSAVFEGNIGKTKRLVSNVKRSCARGASTFPYQMTSHYFDAVGHSAPSGMFESFLSDLLRHRHDIVHGNTLANGLGVNALDDYITKAQLLAYGYVLAICQGD